MKTRLCLSVLFLLMLVTPGDAKDPEVDVVTLQAENRMLKAQVASLKKKLEAGKISIKGEPATKAKTPLQKIEQMLVDNDPSWWKDVSKFDLQTKLRFAVEGYSLKEGFGQWVKRNKGFSGEKVDWKISRFLPTTGQRNPSGEKALTMKLQTERNLKGRRSQLSRLEIEKNRPKAMGEYEYTKACFEKEISRLEQDVSFLEKVAALDQTVKNATCQGVVIRLIVRGVPKTKEFYEQNLNGEPHIQGEILSVQRYVELGKYSYPSYGWGIYTVVDVVGEVVYKPRKSEPKQIRRPKTVGHRPSSGNKSKPKGFHSVLESR